MLKSFERAWDPTTKKPRVKKDQEDATGSMGGDCSLLSFSLPLPASFFYFFVSFYLALYC